jgi:hypothetical protein
MLKHASALRQTTPMVAEHRPGRAASGKAPIKSCIRLVSATDLMDELSRPTVSRALAIGLRCVRPQLADIMDAVAAILAVSAGSRSGDSSDSEPHDDSSPPDSDRDLQRVIENWRSLPRDIQSAVADVVRQACRPQAAPMMRRQGAKSGQSETSTCPPAVKPRPSAAVSAPAWGSSAKPGRSARASAVVRSP